LNPTGTVTGRALVAYNPGISGMAKNAANEIANELKSKGYEVDLAGVRKAPADTSSYDVIIAGGPLYGGKLTRSMDAYLKTLKLQKKVNLGVFATTGTDKFVGEDFQSLTKQVETLVDIPLSKEPTIKLIRSKDKSTEDISALVSETIH
jgi:menaquinone-dependent protoporphyrinogen IX oxidase